jgi:hypothetical protein
MERRITEIETPELRNHITTIGKGNNMLTSMFNTLFPSTKKEIKTMANSTQYVVYTRNFKSKAKQIGVFAEPASTYKDFTVEVLGVAPKNSALTMKSNIISLLKKSGRKVINYSA